MDVIIPTWAEVNSYFAIAIVLIGFCVFAWVKGKKEEERTAKWIRDWEEY